MQIGALPSPLSPSPPPPSTSSSTSIVPSTSTVPCVYRDTHFGGAWTASEDLAILKFAQDNRDNKGPKWRLLPAIMLATRTVDAIIQRWKRYIKPRLNAQLQSLPAAAAEWADALKREERIGEYAGFYNWTGTASEVDLQLAAAALQQSAMLAQIADPTSLQLLLDALMSPNMLTM